MVLHFPSFDLIHSFVAVGRRMSMTLAAQDLCLTQSAVSRQIRALEDAMGVKLLSRGYRSISFTPEGERLFRVADDVVQRLHQVCAELSDVTQRMPVTITASIGVTALWLLPRLGRFQEKHPHIDVRVAANNKLLDLRREGVDLAIRYCTASDAPPGSTRLFEESVVPTADPSLAVRPLDSPEAITEHVLLEFDDPQRPWLQWGEQLDAMGFGGVKPKGILRFNQYDHVIQAAVAGQGIALGRMALVEPMLKDKRLVTLAGGKRPEPSGYAYWLVQADPEPRDDVAHVIRWIKSEARKVGLMFEGDAAGALQK